MKPRILPHQLFIVVLLLSLLPASFARTQPSSGVFHPMYGSFSETGDIPLGTGPYNATYTGQNLKTGVIDTVHGFAYFATNGYNITKVNLSSFTQVAPAIQLTIAEGDVLSGVIDPTHGFAYFGTNIGVIVKVDLSTFTDVGDLTPPLTSGPFTAAVIDLTNGFAYFGNNLGVVVKVDLSSFTVGGYLTLSIVNVITTGVIDPTHGFAYFTTGTVPAKVMKVDLSSFTEVNSVYLHANEGDTLCSVIDPTNGFAYFCSGGNYQAYLVKFDLSTFTEVSSIAIFPGSDYVLSAAIDVANGYLYLGDWASAYGKVSQVDLHTFVAIGWIYLSGVPFVYDSESLTTALFDATNGYVYFGSDFGYVIQVQIPMYVPPVDTAVPIQCTMANGASSIDLTLSTSDNDSVLNPSTVPCDGISHSVVVEGSITLTAAEPADSYSVRERFSGGATNVSITTCPTGTCSVWAFPNYEQVEITYEAVPTSPSLWDDAYSVNVNGMSTGSGGTLCSVDTSFGGSDVSCVAWPDYNTLTSLPNVIGASWRAQGTYSFDDVTGGNTDTVDYVFATTTTSSSSSHGDGFMVSTLLSTQTSASVSSSFVTSTISSTAFFPLSASCCLNVSLDGGLWGFLWSVLACNFWLVLSILVLGLCLMCSRKRRKYAGFLLVFFVAFACYEVVQITNPPLTFSALEGSFSFSSLFSCSSLPFIVMAIAILMIVSVACITVYIKLGQPKPKHKRRK